MILASDVSQIAYRTYYPPEPPLKHLLNPFRKNDIPQVPDFTIGMLIESARAGRWLYD
ncbi:acyl carrier protein [Salmonella enterica]|nr:acyl carrier protein [Salmonella enterica]